MRNFNLPCPFCKNANKEALHFYTAPKTERGKKPEHQKHFFACKHCVGKIKGAELGDPLPSKIYHVTWKNPSGM